jgi:hypothetical protein
MKSAWIACPLVLGSLLLTTPAKLAARAPKRPNSCHDLKNDLDYQVNSLHKRQDDELGQCRQAQGKNSDVCRDLQEQQKIELQKMRDQRTAELNNCGLRANRLNSNGGQISALDNDTYNNINPYDRDHRHKHHKQPKDPNKNPPSVAKNPPSHNGGGNKLPHQPEGSAPRSTGNSAASSSHSAGSSSFHSGGSGSSSSHSAGSSNSSSSSHSEAGTSRPK